MVRAKQRDGTEPFKFHVSGKNHQRCSWSSCRCSLYSIDVTLGLPCFISVITQGSLISFSQGSTSSICSHQPREQLREGHRESDTARRPGTFSYNIRVVQHIEPPPQHLHPQKAQLLCKTPVSLIIWIRAHPRPTCP